MTITAEDAAVVADRTYKRMMSYLGKKRLPLPAQVERDEIRTTIAQMATNAALIDMDALVPTGVVKDNMHPLYMRKLLATMFEEMVDLESDELDVLESGGVAD